MKKYNITKSVLIASFLFLAASPAHSTSINFDGTGAGGLFGGEPALTNLYSGLGVTFSGISGPGMEILNQSGNFGFNAHSGTDFLAWNNGITGSSERMTFSSLLSSASIWVASSSAGTYSMQAFDSNSNLLASDSITGSTSWQQLTVSAQNIAFINIFNSNVNGSGAYDDLSFQPNTVPEPTTLALMGLALAGIGCRRRQSKKA